MEFIWNIGKKEWCVVQNAIILGYVRRHPAWKKYAFYPSDACVFDISRMSLVIDFLEKANKNVLPHKASA